MWWSWNEFFTDMGKLIAGIVIVLVATYFGGNAEEKKGMKGILRKFWGKVYEYALLTSIVTGVMFLVSDRLWYVWYTYPLETSLKYVIVVSVTVQGILAYVKRKFIWSKKIKTLQEIGVVSTVIVAVELWMFYEIHGICPEYFGTPAIIIFLTAWIGKALVELVK